MGWMDSLDKIRLADIQGTLKFGQGGLINVKVENNHYHLHVQNEEAVKKFKQTTITPEIEKEIKDDVRKRLEYVGSSLDSMSGTTMQEVVVATSTTASLDFIKKL